MFWEIYLTLWSSLAIRFFILTMVFLISMNSFLFSDSSLFNLMDTISYSFKVIFSSLNHLFPLRSLLCYPSWSLPFVLITFSPCVWRIGLIASDSWCGLPLPFRAYSSIRRLASWPGYDFRVLVPRLHFRACGQRARPQCLPILHCQKRLCSEEPVPTL